MRDTFYVGFEPELKLWDVARITHTFDQDMWVFRVSARSEHEALLKGLDQYKDLMSPLNPEQAQLFSHIRNQVGKLSRVFHESMIIEIPTSMLAQAKDASDKGFFTFAGNDEVILNLSSVGWKAIQAHETKAPAKTRYIESELAFG